MIHAEHSWSSSVRAFFLSIPLAGLVTPAEAQTPTIEEYWETTSIQFGLDTYSGNSDNVALTGKVEWDVQINLLESDFEANASFHKAAGKDSVDQQNLEWVLRRSFSRTSHWFALLHNWAEHHESSGIDLRATIGPGLGVHLIDNKKTRLTFEGGIAYTHEKHVTTGAEDDFSELFFDPTWKWIINERAELDHEMNFRVPTEDTGNYRIYSETDLTFNITSAVALKPGVMINYDHEPVAGKKKTDIHTKTTLQIKFGKRGS